MQKITILMEKPRYQVGDKLTFEEFSGRSHHFLFLEVASLTKTGAPKVFILGKIRDEIFSNPGASEHVARPNFSERSEPKLMRWYSKRNEYAFEPCYGASYTCLKAYDPEQTYKETWLSD